MADHSPPGEIITKLDKKRKRRNWYEYFLIRHGESVQNTGENNLLKMADHQIYLTEKGKDQARRSAEALKEYISGHPFLIKNERVWYSPYMRTTQTMKNLIKSWISRNMELISERISG